MKKILIHLISYPGAGKYTIAKALKKDIGGYLVDNHIINNVFFSVTDLDKQLPPQVFSFLNKGYDLLFEYIKTLDMQKPVILTNCILNTPNDLAFIKKLEDFCADIGYEYLPVKLILEEEELLKRLQTPERKEKMKLTDPVLYKKAFPEGSLISGGVKNLKELDITGLSVEDSVAALKRFLV